MSTSAAQADAFYREVLEHRVVWGVRDDDGFPAPESSEGQAMPFWSRESRARRVVDVATGYDVDSHQVEQNLASPTTG